MSQTLLHQRYTRSMHTHGYGHAFYDPPSSSAIHPGLCGHIDDNGHFQPFLDATSATETAAANCRPPPQANPDAHNNSTRTWGPLTSTGVNKEEYSIGAGASGLPAGVPVDADLVWSYGHSRDFGAVLFCPKQVTYHGLVLEPFRKWGHANAEALVRNEKFKVALQRHGLFIITSTWTSKEVFTAAWTDRTKKFHVAFSVGATGVGSVGPSIERSQGRAVGGWAKKDEKDLPGPEHVVFFGGIKFNFRKLLGPKEVEQRNWETRGPDPTVVDDPREPGVCYLIEESIVFSEGYRNRDE